MSTIARSWVSRVGTAVRVIRAPFFSAVIVPTLLGTAIAWDDGVFHEGYLLLTLAGIVAINAGLNLSNDYFDHLSGGDEINRELTPFSGGSRAIQQGVASPETMRTWALVFYLIGIGIGVFLALSRGWLIWALGITGVFFALFHNAPPVRLYHRAAGLGELAAGLGCGPLVVLGAYYVQTQQVRAGPLWASLPLGLLIAAVLTINEFPDHDADRAAGKRTLVVAWGRERAWKGYAAMLAAAYATLVLGVALRALPPAALLGLITAPLAYRCVQGARRFHSDTPRLVPTNGATIMTHLLTGLLLTAGYILAGLVS